MKAAQPVSIYTANTSIQYHKQPRGAHGVILSADQRSSDAMITTAGRQPPLPGCRFRSRAVDATRREDKRVDERVCERGDETVVDRVTVCVVASCLSLCPHHGQRGGGGGGGGRGRGFADFG